MKVSGAISKDSIFVDQGEAIVTEGSSITACVVFDRPRQTILLTSTKWSLHPMSDRFANVGKTITVPRDSEVSIPAPQYSWDKDHE